MPDEHDELFEEVTDDDRNLALLMHLLALVTGFIGPLIIWLVKKDDSPYLDQHGKEALNFQISLLIYSFSIGVIGAITCGWGLILFFPFIVLVFVGCIMAAVQGYRGERCSYPLTPRFLK